MGKEGSALGNLLTQLMVTDGTSHLTISAGYGTDAILRVESLDVFKSDLPYSDRPGERLVAKANATIVVTEKIPQPDAVSPDE